MFKTNILAQQVDIKQSRGCLTGAREMQVTKALSFSSERARIQEDVRGIARNMRLATRENLVGYRRGYHANGLEV